MPDCQTSFRSFLHHCVLTVVALIALSTLPCLAQKSKTPRVIAFYTAKNDQAHISFVHEANRFFPQHAAELHYQYDSTSDWSKLNTTFLKDYQLVIFLDTRPEQADQRLAFEQYMRAGGAWMGFHFSAFALEGSEFPDNWPWYHQSFLGTGDYKGNTWRPTSAVLHIEQPKSPSVAGLKDQFKTSPNEWYSWQRDLRLNDSIKIILSVDCTSFPLGTGPKLYEIWHQGYYPVAWTNRYYRMLYFNMGHNDIDYEHGTNKELSFTFADGDVSQFVLNTLSALISGQSL